MSTNTSEAPGLNISIITLLSTVPVYQSTNPAGGWLMWYSLPRQRARLTLERVACGGHCVCFRRALDRARRNVELAFEQSGGRQIALTRQDYESA